MEVYFGSRLFSYYVEVDYFVLSNRKVNQPFVFKAHDAVISRKILYCVIILSILAVESSVKGY